MRCPRCSGLMVYNHDDLKCLNCGHYHFPKPVEPVTLREQIQLALFHSQRQLRRTHAIRA